MFRLAALLLCFLAIPARAAEPDALLSEMRALEARRGEAIRTGDFATLRRIYARDFHGRTADGQEVDRDALFAIFRRNLGTTIVARSFIARAQRQGPSFVGVEGRLELIDPATGRLVGGGTFLHFFQARRGGGWEMVEGRAAHYPQPRGERPPSPLAR
jgi:hypothetical protein